MKFRLFVLAMLLLAVVPAYAERPDGTYLDNYTVIAAVVQSGEGTVCVRVEEFTDVVCPYVENLKVLVDPKSSRTYLQSTRIISDNGTIGRTYWSSIIVRSEHVRQLWLSRLKAAKPPADIIPTVKR
jgi:hypothetical protein